MGVIAGWPIEATLTGDASLSSRPMRRVTEPLSAMGAAFEATEAGTLPVTIHGRDGLQAAQLLLARGVRTGQDGGALGGPSRLGRSAGDRAGKEP